MVALLSAIMVMPASATTIEVNTTGWWIDPAQFNSSSNPIQAALNKTSDGDTVFVHAGTYVLTTECHGWQIHVNTQNITLKGEGADCVTLDGNNGEVAIWVGPESYGVVGLPDVMGAAPGCIVEGFRIINSNLGVDIKVNSPNCIIRNNVFEDISSGAVATKASNTTFKGNVMNMEGNNDYAIITYVPITFVDNVVSNVTGDYCAVYIRANDSIIINNTIVHNKCSASSSRALTIREASNCIVTDNTIANNNGDGILLWKTSTANNTIARNNIYANTRCGICLRDAGLGNKIYLNDIVDNPTSVILLGTPPAVTYWNSTSPIEYTYSGNTYTNYLGNYWSDYTGSDGDGNGLGDTSYVIPDSLDEDFHPLMVKFEKYFEELLPSTSFLISGEVNYTSGDPVPNPAVTVTNLATSGEFTVKTVADSNYYLVLTDSNHVSAGDTIRINASDETVFTETDHTVTASDMNDGGFVPYMLLEAGGRPDLLVIEKSEEWVSLVDKTYNITYTVANIGSVDADASNTSIKIDGVEVGTDPVPALAAGGNYTSTIGPFTMSGDNDMIEVCADSGNVVVEIRESNNCLENLFEYPDMPDLILSRIALKTDRYVNEENILGVTIKNIASSDANSFNVSLKVDGTPLGEQTVPSLGAGNSTDLEFVWIPTELRAYELEAVADTRNEVEESNETNNILSGIIIKRTNWPQFHCDEAHVGFSPSKAPNTNETLWISEDIGAIAGSSTVVVDGKIFVNCGDSLTALNESTGEVLWSSPAEAGGQFGSWTSPSYHDGRVFINGEGAYSATDGSKIWDGLPSNTNGGPMIADGKVFQGDWGRHYYCLDEETGELLWTFTEENTGSWGTAYTQGTPAYADGKVYLTTWVFIGGYVYCVDADTGAEIWNQTTPLDTCGSPTVANGITYVTTYNFYGDGDIYAMNADTGDILWRQTIQRTDSTPTVAYGNVYVTGGARGFSDRQTYCFNATTGDVIWSTDTADEIGGWTCSVAVADGKVFVGTEGGDGFDYATTYALDAFTGDVIWSYPAGGASPAVANGTVFTIGGGKVYAFGGSEIPAGVTFDLKKLNLNSSGILKAFITLPEGYDVADIDVSTVECEGAHTFGGGSVIPGKQALEVKFKIPGLVDVPTGDAVLLSVTGELTTGERFEGSNTVKVTAK